MSKMIKPYIPLRPEPSVRALMSRQEISAVIASRTRSAVAGVTVAWPLITRETVAVETRARRATVVMFMPRIIVEH